ncbi:MAG: hypothetical protein ABSB58_10150, partial [Gemmatimonadales bacterium]
MKDCAGAPTCRVWIRPEHSAVEDVLPIEHVSDTARWVAVHRAMESERPDALFRDPFARRLAG